MLDPGSAARAFRLASRSKDFRVRMATGYRLHSIDKRFQRLLDRLDDAEQAQLVRDGQA